MDNAFVPELQEKLEVADTIIIISECSSASRMAYQHWLTAVPNALCNYASSCGKTSIVVSADKPYDVQLYPNADAILAVYGCKGSSADPTTVLLGEETGDDKAYGPNILAAVEIILGTFSPSGKLPIHIPVYDVEHSTYSASLAYERGYGLSYQSTDDPEKDTDKGVDEALDEGDGADDETREGAGRNALAIALASAALICVAVGALILVIRKKRSMR